MLKFVMIPLTTLALAGCAGGYAPAPEMALAAPAPAVYDGPAPAMTPAAYQGDRELDSLGPHGRVFQRVRSIADIPAVKRACAVPVVARGVRGFAVSHRCMCEHGLTQYCGE